MPYSRSQTGPNAGTRIAIQGCGGEVIAQPRQIELERTNMKEVGCVIRNWVRVLAVASLLGAAGCHDESTIVSPDAVPYRVEGVRSVTGDGLVTVSWRANQESDIDHYDVYRNFAPTGTFTLIGTTADIRFEPRRSRPALHRPICSRCRRA